MDKIEYVIRRVDKWEIVEKRSDACSGSLVHLGEYRSLAVAQTVAENYADAYGGTVDYSATLPASTTDKP